MTDFSKYKPFTADGRTAARDVLERYLFPAGTRPVMTNHARCRAYLDSLIHHGKTEHSPQGGLLWIGAAWARANNRLYTIETHYAEGVILGYTFKIVGMVGAKPEPKTSEFICRKCGEKHGIPMTVMAGAEKEWTHSCLCGARVTVINGLVRPLPSLVRRTSLGPRKRQPRNPK